MPVIFGGQFDPNVLKVGDMVGDILAEIGKPAEDFRVIFADPASHAPVFHLATPWGLRKCKVSLLFCETWTDGELRAGIKAKIWKMYLQPDRATMGNVLAARATRRETRRLSGR
jgi:hypothetical protein